jgi:hypothetical protein
MPNHDNPIGRENESISNPPPVPPIGTAHANPANGGPDHDPQHWWQQPPNWGHILHAVTIAVGLGVAWIYWMQLDEMSKQTKLLNEQANRSTIENIGTAASTKQQLTLLQQQNEAAQNSVQTIQKQFRLEQRPLVRINAYDLRAWPTGEKIKVQERGKPVEVNIHFLNVGKTNAINAIVHGHVILGSQIAQFRIEPADAPDGIGDVLVPGTTDDEGIMVTAISIKDPYAREDASLNVGQLLNWDGTQISVFGRIAYEDQYGTKYCLPYMVNLLPQGGWVNVGKLSVIDSGETRNYTTSQLCPLNTHR